MEKTNNEIMYQGGDTEIFRPMFNKILPYLISIQNESISQNIGGGGGY